MESRDFLVVNGQYSSNDYGLYVDTPPMLAMAAQKTSVLNIPGREESLYQTLDAYEDVTLNVKAYSFSNDYDISQVYLWLRTAKRISFGSNPKYWFKVKKVNAITPNYSGHGKNMYTLSFVISPFRYLADDEAISSRNATFTVENTGNVFCRPVYTIYAQGDISISTVDPEGNELEKLEIFSVNGECMIDSERLVVYKDKELLRTSGKIPLLQVGVNRFRTTGNIESVTLRRYQREV